MDVRLARVHYPLTVLGPGRRVGVWFQGCTIGCHGCMSRDTWDPSEGESIDTRALCDIILAARDDESVDGVTISGGEPFQQPLALLALCKDLRLRWSSVDLLIYSGLPLHRLECSYPDILALADAVISEPFIDRLPTDLPWRGSANQQLTVLSDRLRARYTDPTGRAAARLQVAVDEDGMWVAGIPRRGDLGRMRAAMLARGIDLEDVSWTT